MFDESEEGQFVVPQGHAKVGAKITTLPGTPKLHLLQDNKSTYVFCSFSSIIFYFVEIIASNHLKGGIF